MTKKFIIKLVALAVIVQQTISNNVPTYCDKDIKKNSNCK